MGWVGGATVAVALAVGGTASAAPGLTFALDLKPVSCAIKNDPKHFLIVPCSLVTHEIEIYAVVHGRWGRHLPSRSIASERAHRRCGATFKSLYGNTIDNGFSWWGFWASSRREFAKYGDRVVCGLARRVDTPTGPVVTGMGKGTHFEEAAKH
jgi:hypothetical protein